MATFSNIGCTPTNGLSEAATNAVNTINELKTASASNLSAALSVANDINSYSFDRANFSPDYDGSGQLGDHPLADKPTLADVSFTAPDDPGPSDGITGQFGEIDETDIVTYLPDLDTTLIDKLVTELCNILDNGTDLLPQPYECLLWEQSRSTAQRETDEQKAQIAADWASRGWSSPQGPEIAAHDALVRDEDVKLAMASRDIAFKIYDTAIEVMLAALAATGEYFDAWGDLYEAWTDAQNKLGDRQLIYARQRLAQLNEQIRIFQTRSDNERARIASLFGAYGSNIGVYQSQIQYGSHTDRRNQAEFGLETVRREIGALENQQHNRASAAAIRTDIQEELARLREKFAMYGRAVSAQLQSMNFSSTVASRVSATNSKGCSTGYSYNERVTL